MKLTLVGPFHVDFSSKAMKFVDVGTCEIFVDKLRDSSWRISRSYEIRAGEFPEFHQLQLCYYIKNDVCNGLLTCLSTMFTELL